MIDLRAELKKLLDEHWDKCVIRVMSDTRCFCWRKGSNTPTPECPNCEGSGYVFNEYLIKCKFFYSPVVSVAHAQDFDYGLSYKNLMIGYIDVTSISEQVKINDELYQIATKINGDVISPIERTRRWLLNDVYKLNLDNGKREFVKFHAKPKTL